MPAKRLPSITELAPPPGLGDVPDCRIPPSAITGIPRGSQTDTAFMTAVTWGTPMPVTIRWCRSNPDRCH